MVALAPVTDTATPVSISTPTKLDVAIGRPEWQYAAACRGRSPHLWTVANAWREAKAICADCPVRSECLEYALQHRDVVGTWGGTTEPERERIQRQRARAAGQSRAHLPVIAIVEPERPSIPAGHIAVPSGQMPARWRAWW